MIEVGHHVGDWVADASDVRREDDEIAIGWRRNGRIECGIILCGWTPDIVFQHSRLDGRLSAYWAYYCAHYVFEQAKRAVVVLPIVTSNVRSAAVARAFGAQHTGVVPRGWRGQNLDIWTLVSDDCVFLHDERWLRRAAREQQTS